MMLVSAILTLFACFLPVAMQFVIPAKTTATSRGGGCVRTKQRPSRSQPLLPPLSKPAAKKVKGTTSLAMVADGGSALRTASYMATVASPIVYLVLGYVLLSQYLKLNDEAGARNDAQFAYQQKRDAEQDLKTMAQFAYRVARDMEQDVKDNAQFAYQRARDAKQNARDNYTMFINEQERNEKKIQRLRSKRFRSKADNEKLAVLEAEREEIASDLADAHDRLYGARDAEQE
mmetsp:Transcript_11716/g.33774  ORF Transcript_11716/g.33774 Transcript_11716/m.33774 type:complete len:232 (-) Transcript_11716:76-771(-)